VHGDRTVKDGLEYIAEDELVEITPDAVRPRKAGAGARWVRVLTREPPP